MRRATGEGTTTTAVSAPSSVRNPDAIVTEAQVRYATSLIRELYPDAARQERLIQKFAGLRRGPASVALDRLIGLQRAARAIPSGGATSGGTFRPAPSTLPDVPEGYYATPSRTGTNDLDFWRVDRPTEGRWAGRTFVKRVIGGHPDANVRGAEVRLALEAIQAAGPQSAAEVYGREIGRCGMCNRHLTDAVSRARGIGPDCYGRMPW